MAEKKPAQPASAPKVVPFPPEWPRMTAGKKRDWLQKYRPQPVPPAEKPAAAPVVPHVNDADYSIPPDSDMEPQEPTTLETPCGDQAADTIRVTIQLPGKDVAAMDGRELIKRILAGWMGCMGESAH